MIESTLTSKGQTTVPADIRERLGLVAGVRLVWHPMPDGSVKVRAKSGSILDLDGRLARPGQATVPLDAMDPWR